MTDSSDKEKIIQFPGLDQSEGADAAPTSQPNESAAEAEEVTETVDPAGVMNEHREKAMQIALSGMSFITIGIQPTGSGADFFTSIDGVEQDLLDALPVLVGVIARAVERRFGDGES